MREKQVWQKVRRVSVAIAMIVGLALQGVRTVKATPAQQAIPVSWFFAEGSTDPPFDTWFLVENPTDEPANVRFTFQFPNSVVVSRSFVVGADSRFSLFANEILPRGGFSTRIDADRQVFAERSMYFSFDGHVVTGIPAPNTTWLFAEGSTDFPFHTWLLLQNPNDQAAAATIIYFLAEGAPVVQGLNLPPTSRTSIFVNDVIPNRGFSMQVLANRPIVAERAMYRFPGNAGTGVSGVNAASTKWFFAEGNSTPGNDTWLLLANPYPLAVEVSISLLSELGDTLNFRVPMAPTSRRSEFLSQIFPFQSFSISLEASAPIVAERAMYVGVGEPRAAHATQGATRPANVWQLAEGSTDPPFEESISVLNTNVEQTTFLRFEFFLPDGRVLLREFSVGPQRKFFLLVNNVVPRSGVSTRVSGSRPIVVERSMFFNKLGQRGATNTIGIETP